MTCRSPRASSSVDRPGVPRFIRLRRPVVLSLAEAPFVPDLDALQRDEVEERWESLCASNPAYFDGRLCHVLGVHRNGHGGAQMHLADCAYRFHAVQDDAFDVGIRPLGVKGIVERDGHFLMGRRSMRVGSYAGLWEFAPAGVVEPGEEPAVTVARELEEETGFAASSPPVPVAVMEDDVLRCWEIVFRIEATTSDVTPTGEYEAIEWVRPGAWPSARTPVAQAMIDHGLAAPAASGDTPVT